MRDMNIAKLTSVDVPLFNAIVQDLFPNIELPAIDYGKVFAFVRVCGGGDQRTTYRSQFPLPPGGFWGSDSDNQAWLQVSLLTELLAFLLAQYFFILFLFLFLETGFSV